MQKITTLRKLYFLRLELRLQVTLLIPLLFIITVGIISIHAFGDNSSNMKNADWKTIPSVGKYLYNEPQKPSQIFNIQYRVVNGTLDSIISTDGSYSAEVRTEGSGLFQLKIPLNYPYTNFENVTNGQTYLIFINDKEVSNIFTPTRLDDCFFGFSISFSQNVKINLGSATIPEHFPYHGEEVPAHCIKETILSIPPLQQLKAGISANDIVCKQGFELVVKSKNNSPVCIKPSSVQKLVTWGWARSLAT